MSSVLFSVTRPIVVFDTKDHTHLSYAWYFLRHNRWGACPIQFDYRGYSNVRTMLIDQLAQYYEPKHRI